MVHLSLYISWLFVCFALFTTFGGYIYIYASHSIYFISGTADPKLKDCKVIFVIGKY